MRNNQDAEEQKQLEHDRNLYIDPVQLRNLIREYKTDLKNNPNARMSDALGLCLVNLAKRFSSRSCFSSYSYRSDFESAAVEKMIKAVEHIDPDDSRSPFAYLTQTCYRTIINYIKKEKKYTQVKDSVADYVYNEFARQNGIAERHNPNSEEQPITDPQQQITEEFEDIDK